MKSYQAAWTEGSSVLFFFSFVSEYDGCIIVNTGAIEELNQHKGPKRENLTLQIHFWAREYHLSTISGVSDAVSVRQSTANIFSYSVQFKLSTHILKIKYSSQGSSRTAFTPRDVFSFFEKLTMLRDCEKLDYFTFLL